MGRNAFAHESGIHQDGVLKERSTYEIMAATSVGFDATHRSCSASTPAATRCRAALEDLGYTVNGHTLNQAFKRFKELADKKKQVTAMDLEALVTDELRDEAPRLHARVVRRRGLLPPPAARHGLDHHARRRERRAATSPATARSTRSSAPSTPPPGATPGCASSASTRSPAARTRSARRCVILELVRLDRVRPGRLDRHHRGRRARLRARARQRRAQGRASPPRRRREQRLELSRRRSSAGPAR